MQAPQQVRRAGDQAGTLPATALADAVRHGILLKAASSTMAAVEYLTARGVDAAVIRRVMSGHALLRDADRRALALQQYQRDAQLVGDPS